MTATVQDWWIVNKINIADQRYMTGTFGDACRAAKDLCTTNHATYVIWTNDPGIKPIRAAEFAMRGGWYKWDWSLDMY